MARFSRGRVDHESILREMLRDAVQAVINEARQKYYQQTGGYIPPVYAFPLFSKKRLKRQPLTTPQKMDVFKFLTNLENSEYVSYE